MTDLQCAHCGVEASYADAQLIDLCHEERCAEADYAPHEWEETER